MHRILSAALAAAALALPAFANDGVAVRDAYARISPHAGAVFLVIENHAAADDRLVSATTDAAGKAELHTHKEDANGMMQMLPVEGGIPVPANGTAELARGGDHVMLIDLVRPLAQGDTFTVILGFESGAAVPVEVTVDNDRKPAAHGGHGHGHEHGAPAP
jgi:copper(I)-binding protein